MQQPWSEKIHTKVSDYIKLYINTKLMISNKGEANSPDERKYYYNVFTKLGVDMAEKTPAI